MICDKCLHKSVCKEIENFKEYNKQYEEMKKKSSLFDKPIECPCYTDIEKIIKEKYIADLETANRLLKNCLIEIKLFMITNENLENYLKSIKC